MIFLSIIFLFVVVPTLWGLLVAFAEVFNWQLDKRVARQLSQKFGRDIYEGGLLKSRVWVTFKRGYWQAFGWIGTLVVFGLVLWIIFKD